MTFGIPKACKVDERRARRCGGTTTRAGDGRQRGGGADEGRGDVRAHRSRLAPPMRCWECELWRVSKCELRFFRVGQRSSACSQGGTAPVARGHLGDSHCRSRAGFGGCGVIAVVVTSASLHATPHQRACCECHLSACQRPAALGFAFFSPSRCRASFSSSLLFVALRATARGGASPLSPPARLLRTPAMRTQRDASALCYCTWNLRAVPFLLARWVCGCGAGALGAV